MTEVNYVTSLNGVEHKRIGTASNTLCGGRIGQRWIRRATPSTGLVATCERCDGRPAAPNTPLTMPQRRLLTYLAGCAHASDRQCSAHLYGTPVHVGAVLNIAYALLPRDLVRMTTTGRRFSIHITDAGITAVHGLYVIRWEPHPSDPDVTNALIPVTVEGVSRHHRLTITATDDGWTWVMDPAFPAGYLGQRWTLRYGTGATEVEARESAVAAFHALPNRHRGAPRPAGGGAT